MPTEQPSRINKVYPYVLNVPIPLLCSILYNRRESLVQKIGLFVITVAKWIAEAINAHCPYESDTLYLQCHSRDVLSQALPLISVLGGQRSHGTIIHSGVESLGTRLQLQYAAYYNIYLVLPLIQYNRHCHYTYVNQSRHGRVYIVLTYAMVSRIVSCKGKTCLSQHLTQVLIQHVTPRFTCTEKYIYYTHYQPQKFKCKEYQHLQCVGA